MFHQLFSRTIRSIFAALLVLMLCLNSFSIAESASFPATEHANQLIRVYLTRLNLKDRLDVTLHAPYALISGTNQNIHFQEKSELSFLVHDDRIYLYHSGMTLELGTEFLLACTSAPDDEPFGFQVTNFPELYMGDLQIRLRNGVLFPVLTIHVEDYLLGVVPYEMSNLFPLEALKAQAVAARTYALREQNPSAEYDVVDNTNDQVFRGYVEGNKRAEDAVRETQGICGFYQNGLAQCFYSASNGGQMEAVESVWPDRGDFGYYATGDDPYDVANPLSTVRSFELKKEYAAVQAPHALRKLIADQLASVIVEYGMDPAPENIRVDKVESVSVDTPDRDGSKRMTELHLSVRFSGRRLGAIRIPVEDNDQEEVSLFATTPLQIATKEPATVPEATKEPQMGPFVPLEGSFSIDIPIFPDAEQVFGMDILGHYDNEIWSVAEKDDCFVLEARRYGHGVGMSQRGAEWMALTHRKSFQEILAFYYPGLELMQIIPAERQVLQIKEELRSTAGPALTPTPRPTLMPVTQTLLPGQWYAIVTEIADDSSLNLRAEPTMNADILMRLYKHQELLVEERCAEDGWVKVRTDAAEGYVMEKYLTAK